MTTVRPMPARPSSLGRPSPRTAAVLVVMTLTSLLLVACSSSSTSSDAPRPTGTDTAAKSNVTLPADGAPRSGGKVVYGLEAESDGWNPTQSRWAVSGTQVGLAIYDPLAAYDTDGAAQPYLAASFSPNADFTRWTVTLRPNVTFHDGTPLTADAVKQTFDRHLASGLTKPAVADLERVEVTDPLTATFVMRAPWAAFPATLTGEIGMVVAPATLNDPQGARRPIGTGPFAFESWTPDQSLVTKRNPSYWQKDASGTQLPYLDAVEFRPIPDGQSRLYALKAGDISMMQTDKPQQIQQLREEARAGSLQLVEDHGESEEDFVMLNNASPPFDDPVARQAVAHATDRDQFNTVLNLDALEPADSVFTHRSKYYAPTPFPGYDLAEATRLTQQYQQQTGQPLAFTLTDCGTEAWNINETSLLKQQYEAAGMQVTVRTTEQSTCILDVVTGGYQAVIWRQFGSPDPDFDRVWWSSESAQPVGQVSLNMARLKDPQLDAALTKGRSTTDEATRKEAYATVQQRFAEDLAYIWLDHSLWVVGASNKVRGITNGPLPDGKASMPLGGPGGFGGVTRMTQTWLAA